MNVKSRQRPSRCVHTTALPFAVLIALAVSCGSPEPQNDTQTQRPSTDTPAAPQEPDPTGVGLSNDGTYYVTYKTSPDPIPLNDMFSIDVRVYESESHIKPAENITLRADGRMPAHRHGMNTAPRIEQIGPGHFRVRGMLFHMPGDWELDFDIERDGLVERAQFDVILE